MGQAKQRGTYEERKAAAKPIQRVSKIEMRREMESAVMKAIAKSSVGPIFTAGMIALSKATRHD